MQGKFLTRSLLAIIMATSPLLASTSAHANISVAQSTDGIIAKVNDSIILKSELVAAMALLDNQYKSQGVRISSQELQELALDTLITRKLQLELINRAGVTPNEEVINRQLLQIAQGQGFSSLADFQRSIDGEQAGSYAALRRQLIEDSAIIALLQHQVNSRINISDQEVEAFLKSPEAASIAPTQYRLLHVRVPVDANDTDKTAVNDVVQKVSQSLQRGDSLSAVLAQGKGYKYELQGADTGMINQNALPEYLAPQLANLPVGGVSQPILTQGGIDVVKLVDKNTSAKILIPEWHTSHILAKVDGTQSASMAEQKINALYAELQKGANFAELAATYSEDTGSAQQRGSLGWVGENEMVPEFEAVMKNTETGDFSTPFRSQFGWHILKVDNARQRDVTDQYLKNAAREMIFSRIAPQAQEDWIQELRAGAYIKIMD